MSRLVAQWYVKNEPAVTLPKVVVYYLVVACHWQHKTLGAKL